MPYCVVGSKDTATKRRGPIAQPKRKQVGLACNHCRKAHAGCDHKRPCGRCVRLGRTDCQDAAPKRVGHAASSTRSRSRSSSPSSASKPKLLVQSAHQSNSCAAAASSSSVANNSLGAVPLKTYVFSSYSPTTTHPSFSVSSSSIHSAVSSLDGLPPSSSVATTTTTTTVVPAPTTTFVPPPLLSSPSTATHSDDASELSHLMPEPGVSSHSMCKRARLSEEPSSARSVAPPPLLPVGSDRRAWSSGAPPANDTPTNGVPPSPSIVPSAFSPSSLLSATSVGPSGMLLGNTHSLSFLVDDTQNSTAAWGMYPLFSLPEPALGPSSVPRLPDEDLFAIPWLDPLLEEVI